MDEIRVLISEEELDKRIRELGAEISRDYAGKKLHLISVLKGGVFFTCELAKRITIPVTIDFMCVSSYGNETSSSGVVNIVKDLEENIVGKDVMVIEDIVDSGRTLSYLMKILKEREPNTLALCTLLDKPMRRTHPVRVESERDIDMLTGVLSRRRLKADFEDLIAHPETAKHGLVCMIDADGLKEINDSYGHVCGDRYLTVIADKLNTFGSRENLTGRLGGDEFVMFLYGYDTDEELEQDIRKLPALQNHGTMEISDGVTIPIRFSIGRAKTFGNSDPHALLLSADQAMYNDKMNRKTRTGSDTSDSGAGRDIAGKT